MAIGYQKWRLNGVVGKIVPLLLLLYLVLMYRLIIFDYSYHRIILEQGRAKDGLLYILILHALFLPALHAYMRVFLARSTEHHDVQATSWTSYLVGAPLPQPPIDPPIEILEKRTIFECDAQGDPLRCHRDQCKGRWKPARSRHCGDCRQCRLALDHHCPWFDADVMAPQTLTPFLLFLALIPPLLSLVIAPLLSPSYHHILFIWRHARSSDHVNRIWWSRKKSWIGGPMYRWVIGLWLGSRDCCYQAKDVFVSPNLYLPVMVFLAIALILVASALLFSTLQQLVYGDLTIDVRVRAVLLRRAAGEGHVRGQRYFWVPIADHPEQGVVVASAAHEQPYDLGSWTENMRAFLCLPPYTAQEMQLQWPISSATKARLVEQAKTQIRKGV